MTTRSLLGGMALATLLGLLWVRASTAWLWQLF
jgi:hypothetical protein